MIGNINFHKIIFGNTHKIWWFYLITTNNINLVSNYVFYCLNTINKSIKFLVVVMLKFSNLRVPTYKYFSLCTYNPILLKYYRKIIWISIY